MVGKIIKPHGVQGAVKVLPLSDVEERFLPGVSLFLEGPEHHTIPIEIEAVIPMGKQLVLALKGFSTLADADRIRGWTLSIPKSKVPSLGIDTFFIHQLIGLTVVEGGENRGVVRDVVEGPAYDYLVIQLGEKENLLPFVHAYVTEVSIEKGQVRVACPDGFWE